MKLFHNLVATLSLLLLTTIVSAQNVEVEYDISKFSFGIFSSKWEDPGKVTLVREVDIPQGKVTYIFPQDVRQSFDLKTLSLSPAVASDKFKDVVFSGGPTPPDINVVGQSWTTSLVTPPQVGSRCPNTLQINLTSTVKGTEVWLVRGEAVGAVRIEQQGEWSAPSCGKGLIKSTIVFAPSLNTYLFAEGLSYLGTRQVAGTRSTLVGAAPKQQEAGVAVASADQ